MALDPLASDVEQAQASSGATCQVSGGTAQNNLKVYPSHGKVFYIDSGQRQNVDAAYAGYRVENIGATAKTNLWARVDSFTGGVVSLANASDAVFRVGDIATNQIQPAFFLMQAASSSTRAQSHVFRVFDRDPRVTGATELYNCTYTFVAVRETIKAQANKVVGLESVSENRIGGNLVVTVKGQTGIIGSGTSSPDGQVIWFSPASRSSWPSASLRLASTQVRFSTGQLPGVNGAQNESTHLNRLVFLNPRTTLASNAQRFFYEAVYTFRIVGPVSSSLQALPIAQISSGTQIKHTDVEAVASQGGSTLEISTPVTVDVTKSVAATVRSDGLTRFLDYTVTLNNTSTEVALDRLIDEPPAGLSFSSGSALFRGAAIPDPVARSSGELVYQGPFSVPNGASTLTYSMQWTCEENTDLFAYTNFAYAEIGGLVVGSGGASVSGAGITGACDSETGDTSTPVRTLEPEAITQPATDVLETSATLNGTVDPNDPAGTRQLPVAFQWGTSPSLTGATTVSLGASLATGDFYAVSTTLGSDPLQPLSPGTRYYFRVTIGDVQGQILSFVTPEPPAVPTVVTNAVTEIVPGTTASNGTAVLNATVDPNQTSTTPSFTWGLTGNSGADNTCTNATYTLSGTVREDTTDNGTLDSDVVLTGAFATPVSLEIGSLSRDKFYCVIARGTHSGGVALGDPVVFQVGTIENQTITFPVPTQTNDAEPVTLDSVGQSALLAATTTSGLPITYSTNTPEVCTVTGSVVTIVGGGVCSLSADQSGNTDFYPANTVTINFSIQSFTLVYHLNGGIGTVPVDPQSPLGKNQTVTVLSTSATKANNSFEHWNTQADGNGTTYFPGDTFLISQNIVLYAVWKEAITYTLTYNVNGGSGGPAASDHVEGTTVLLSTTEPVRSGFTFVGWNSQADGLGTSYPPGGSVGAITQDTTVFAIWAVRLTYSGNGHQGGTVPAMSDHVEGSEVAISPAEPTRSGFTFIGWNSEPNGSGAITYRFGTDQATITLGSSRTLYAQWRAQISYDANGAEPGVAPPTDPAGYAPGALATPASPADGFAREGFRFAGWNTQANGLGTVYTLDGKIPISGDITLYAYWLAGVSYEPKGSTGVVPVDDSDYVPNAVALVRSSGALSKTGFTFDGWSANEDGTGTRYLPDDSLTITGATTLYARWVARVTYNGNGNTAGVTPVDGTDYLQGASVPLAARGTLERSGFDFAGWNTQADGLGTEHSGATFVMSGAKTLFAQWRSRLTYDANGATGGSVPTDSQSYRPGQAISITTNSGELVKTGLSFAGWNTQPDGKGTQYFPGDTRSNTGATTLFARWIATVSYDQNPPSGFTNRFFSLDEQGYLPGDSFVVPEYPDPPFTGKLFDGWTTNQPGTGTRYQPGDTVTAQSNTKFYAQWVNALTLTFEGNGNTTGSAPATMVVGEGRSAALPGNTGALSRAGFTLTGWNTSPDGSGQGFALTGTLPMAANAVLYAQWVPNASPPGVGPAVQPPAPPFPFLITPPLRPPTTPPVEEPEGGDLGTETPVQNSVVPLEQEPENRTGPQLPGLRDLGGATFSLGVRTPGVAFSLDLGQPAEATASPGSSSDSMDWLNSTALRTLEELAAERFDGFAPAFSTRIEVLGSRTAARFVMTDTTQIDEFALIQAIQASIPVQAADFFAIDTLASVANGVTPRSWGMEERQAISEFFAGAGLPEPRNLGDLDTTANTDWLLIQTSSSTYLPGTEVFLTVTSDPIVIGSALVDDAGRAVISGTIPLDLLGPGEHRIRLVGIRDLEGAYLNEQGDLQLTSELISEIERFDRGTLSTVAIIGNYDTNTGHIALRVVDLAATPPWWTLWFILGAVLISLAVRIPRRTGTTLRRWGSVALALGSAVPGVVLGWLSTVTSVTWWALGLGLLAALAAALGPYRQPQEEISRVR
jgi:uncharacterized repeat protein (TIGR02543 family)